VSATVTAVILGAFALATVVLVHARQLMREITRTIEEWRKLKQALRDKNTSDEHLTKEDPDNIES
jgi:hypothetical protein